MAELTFLSRQWQVSHDPRLFSPWMASSEVDQKFLGHFAKTTSEANVYLSSMVRACPICRCGDYLYCLQLYKILGLSVILSEKLLRARKNRRLDPTRDTKSVRQLYHHILWLSREGLVIVEQYILPMVGHYVELKVLSYKLRASFYHIFVLFHNQPSVNKSGDPFALFPEPLSPRGSKLASNRDSIQRSPPPQRTPGATGGPVGGGPPGLPPPPQKASPSASFLLPAMDYIPTATSCFVTANTLAERLLPGSHPVRLSVKVEYVAYLYDCLHEGEQSRRLAKRSIADVYNAQEGMDDESFEDAAELVGILGKMMKRGLGGSGSGSGSGSTPGLRAGGSQASRSTPRVPELKPSMPQHPQLQSQETRYTPPRGTNGSQQQGQERRVTPPRGTNGLPAAVPSPGMRNPI